MAKKLTNKKQLLRNRHPIASCFVLIAWLLFCFFSVTNMLAIVAGWLMAYAGGINYFITGKFFIPDFPLGNIDLLAVALLVCPIIIGFILRAIENTITSLYKKYYG